MYNVDIKKNSIRSQKEFFKYCNFITGNDGTKLGNLNDCINYFFKLFHTFKDNGSYIGLFQLIKGTFFVNFFVTFFANFFCYFFCYFSVYFSIYFNFKKFQKIKQVKK